MKKFVFNFILILILCLSVCSQIACKKTPAVTESNSESDVMPDEFFIIKNEQVIGLTQKGSTQTSLVIPNVINGKTITGIWNGAFAENTLLQTVTISEGITTIGVQAFSGCSSLRNINFPSTLNYINDEAFSYCFSLQTLSFPVSLTTIDNNAFLYCDNLKEITYAGNRSVWEKIDCHHDWSLNENLQFIKCADETIYYSELEKI